MWLFFFSCSESLGLSLLAIVGDDSLASCDFALVLRRLEVCGEAGGWDCCCACVCEGIGSDTEGLLCWVVDVGVGGGEDEGGGRMDAEFIFESAIGVGFTGGKLSPRAGSFCSSEVEFGGGISADAEFVMTKVAESSASVPAAEAFLGSRAEEAGDVLEGETGVSVRGDLFPSIVSMLILYTKLP